MNFDKLRCLKVLQTGGKSKYVWLMEKNIIQKAYDRKKSGQLERFQLEVKYLRHLAFCPFVPKPLKVDFKKCVIWMTYVGQVLKNTRENRALLAQKMKELHLDWNLMRHRNGRPNYNVYIGNGTMRKNGEVYVIDFGSLHYRIVGPRVGPIVEFS